MSIPGREATTIGFLLPSDFKGGRRVVDWIYSTPVPGKNQALGCGGKQQMLTFPPSAHFFF